MKYNWKEVMFNLQRKRFASSIKVRVKMYDKMRSLISNTMSMNQVINKLLGRKKPHQIYTQPDTAFLYAASEGFSQGKALSEILKDWATPGEVMLIKSGEDGGDLQRSFETIKNLLEKTASMKKAVIGELGYPIFLMILLFGMIVGFAKFMLPTLTSMSDPENWDAKSKALYSLSTTFDENWVLIVISIIALSFAIGYSVPRLRGKIRDRLDSFPPYSIYKTIQSGLLLISLGTLMSSGVSFRKSLVSIQENSGPYLSEKVKEIVDNVDSGMDNGKAINTKFIGKIGNDIEDYSSGSSIEEALSQLGNSAINDTVESIKVKAGYVKTFSLFLVGGFIIWMYGSFMAIVNDVTTQASSAF
jgi:type II secretory pathway component PulF